jgi:hypothetical protein
MDEGNGTVAGWGRLDPAGRWTRQLRKVEIPLVEWEECAKVFKGAANVTKDMFCTGSKQANLIPCKTFLHKIRDLIRIIMLIRQWGFRRGHFLLGQHYQTSSQSPLWNCFFWGKELLSFLNLQ